MRVMFNGRIKQASGGDRGFNVKQAPGRRPDVPRWRWITVMLAICILIIYGTARISIGLFGTGSAGA